MLECGVVCVLECGVDVRWSVVCMHECGVVCALECGVVCVVWCVRWSVVCMLECGVVCVLWCGVYARVWCCMCGLLLCGVESGCTVIIMHLLSLSCLLGSLCMCCVHRSCC